MSRIWSMMDIGRRSMINSQTALQTVSHNIANKSTEGYSRQRVDVQASVPTGQGKLRIGNGARAAKVTRTNNPYLEKQIQKEGVELGETKTKAETMARVEQVYNEQVNKGLNKFMAEFFNAFREMSNNPESLATRTLVKESAEFLSRDFKRVVKQLQEIQADADFQITSHVNEINEMTKEIADLNEKIQSIELNGSPANDERDRRDLLVKKLGEMINIRYAESEEGSLSITAGNTAVLVSGFSYQELQATPTVKKEGKHEGGVEIFYKSTKNGSPVNITSQIKSGKLGGLLHVRDKEINNLIEGMNTMAFNLAKEVNKAHIHGYDRYNQKADLFFEFDGSAENYIDRMAVSDAIKQDVGRIAAAGAPNSPADNRIANIIADVQYKKVLPGGSTLDSYYNSTVGEIGVRTARINSELQSQTGLVDQLNNIRESISGVSLDEETTKMIEYQKSFDASARLVTTADEMMDTVLGLKR